MAETAPALLVDGNNLVMRAVKAFERPGQSALTADGVPTGPLLVVINTLSRYVIQERPDRVMVAWDGGYSAFRRNIHHGYKEKRKESRSESESLTFGLVNEFCTLAGIHHIERAHVEADDIIGHYSRMERPAVILSSDKDLLQLVRASSLVEQVRLGSADTPTDRWTYLRVVETYGCLPILLAAVMALAGDPGDGVPGVPRIGPKTAVKLLARNSWQLEQALEMEPMLIPYADLARMCFKLVDLSQDLPGLILPRLPRFIPTAADSVFYPGLLEYLTRYRLESVKDRLYARTLWSGSNDHLLSAR